MTIRGPLLKDVAYNMIKEAVLNETFGPGEFLSERKLVEFLGMSKTPIKSAMERLEREGFVSIAPQQGILVVDMPLSKVRDLFDIRIALETFVCKRLCGTLSSEEEEQLKNNLVETRESLAARDERMFSQLDAEFHLLLCRFSDNAELYRIALNYQEQLWRSVMKVLKIEPNRMEPALRDHEKIVTTLLEGKCNEVVSILTEHLVYGQRILIG